MNLNFMKKQSKNYNIMCIIALLQGLVFYGPITMIYKENHGITITEILLLESILIGVMLIFEIPLGVLADKIGYKNTLIICAGGLFISKIIFYNAYSFSFFLIQTIISGISLAGFSGCDYAMLFESIKSEESQRCFGVYQAFGTFGFFIASVGSSILVKYSLDSTVFMSIIAYGIGFIATFFLQPTQKRLSIKKKKQRKKLFLAFEEMKKNKQITFFFIIFLLAIFIIYEVGHSIEAYLVQLQYVRSNISYIYFGIITAVAQLLCMLSAKTYAITKKLGQIKTILLFVLAIIFSVIILTITHSAILSIIFSVIIQISLSMLMPILMDVQNRSIKETSQNRATILSIYSMLGCVIGMIINLLIGLGSDNSVKISFEICLIILVIAFLFIVFYILNSNKIKY
ncbi:MAG: MFS transporter [Sarcina sp.]